MQPFLARWCLCLSLAGMLVVLSSCATQPNPPAAASQFYPEPRLAPPSLTPTPTATPFPTPMPTPTLFPTAAGKLPPGPKVVFAQLFMDKMVIWAVSAQDPSQRIILHTIPYGPIRGLRASISPNGKYLAYLSMPLHGVSTWDNDLWLVDLASQKTTQLTSNVDAGDRYGVPLWSPDSTHLVILHGMLSDYPMTQTISMIDLNGKEETLIQQHIVSVDDSTIHWIQPALWSQNGDAFFYLMGYGVHPSLRRIDLKSRNDALVQRIYDTGGPMCLQVSPDYQKLLCSINNQGNKTLMLVPLNAQGEVEPINRTGDGSPNWTADGSAVITPNAQGDLVIPDAKGQARLWRVRTRTGDDVLARQEGWLPRQDLLDWSPDRTWLAVLRNALTFGDLRLMSADGQQEQVILPDDNIEFVGWTMVDLPFEEQSNAK